MGFDMRGAGLLVRWFVGSLVRWLVRSLARFAHFLSGFIWRVVGGQEWARMGSFYTIHTFSLFFTHFSISLSL
jgi:hypothetical protein